MLTVPDQASWCNKQNTVPNKSLHPQNARTAWSLIPLYTETVSTCRKQTGINALALQSTLLKKVHKTRLPFKNARDAHQGMYARMTQCIHAATSPAKNSLTCENAPEVRGMVRASHPAGSHHSHLGHDALRVKEENIMQPASWLRVKDRRQK